MNGLRKGLGILFVLAWVLMLAGIAGVRWELISLQMALLSASAGAVVLLVFGLLLLPVVLYRLVLRKTGTFPSLVRCVLGLLPAGILLLTVGVDGFRSPAIHDISTDTANPPVFVLALAQRAAGDNSAAYEGESIARVQAEAYPDIAPLQLARDAETVLDAVVKVVGEQGWTLLAREDLQGGDVAGTVEAVARSAVFGFEDDIVIRVTRTDQGCRVDIRSASRVGLGDLGANAGRIRVFSRALTENISNK